MTIYTAKEAFTYDDENGVARFFHPGHPLITEADPAYKGREHLFEAVEATVARTSVTATETASAAPGEVRSVVRRGRKPKDDQPAVDTTIESETEE